MQSVSMKSAGNNQQRPPHISTVVLMITGLLLGSCLFSSARAQAAESCHRPPPETLIAWYNKTHAKAPLNYNMRGSAIYHPISILRTENPVTYWIGLAWLFPQSGALFAVNCAGTILDGISTGAIGHLVLGPKLPEVGQSVMIVYVDKETSSCVHDAVKITALKNNRIISLWTHGYNQGINVAATDGKPRQFVRETYDLKLSDDQQTLSISGLRASYSFLKDGNQAPNPSAAETLPVETYHWNAKTLSYLPAKPYPQSAPCSSSPALGTK